MYVGKYLRLTAMYRVVNILEGLRKTEKSDFDAPSEIRSNKGTSSSDAYKKK